MDTRAEFRLAGDLSNPVLRQIAVFRDGDRMRITSITGNQGAKTIRAFCIALLLAKFRSQRKDLGPAWYQIAESAPRKSWAATLVENLGEGKCPGWWDRVWKNFKDLKDLGAHEPPFHLSETHGKFRISYITESRDGNGCWAIARLRLLCGESEITGLKLIELAKKLENLAPKWENRLILDDLESAEPISSFPCKADISRIIKYAPRELVGRRNELKLIKGAWDKVIRRKKTRPHILTFVGLGGEGKTSLVAKWAIELAGQEWPGCDAVFAWSFYNQGTCEQMAASSDLFLKEAITFFGDDADKEFAASNAGVYEKGQRLARIVGQRRSLLILDGLEPLQCAPPSPTPGVLKDYGIAALLKGLAAVNHGLCVVTTRYSLSDLKPFWQTTAKEVKLLRLSKEAGVHLLKNIGVTGSQKEFEALVEDVKGHALTLQIIGGFLKRAFNGDIEKRDRVRFEIADEKIDGGHAFGTMAAYEQWLLRDGGDEGRREVAVLWLMGLFERPADAGCLAALRSEAIPDLTEQLVGLADEDWEFCLTGLESAYLLTVNRDTAGTLVSIDAHPLLRAYFGRQLRTQRPGVWCAAHRRLYLHLCQLYEHFRKTQKRPKPTLDDLQPLYHAVAHGCQAGMHSESLATYNSEILLGKDYYSSRRLGAVTSNLALMRGFYEKPWDTPCPALSGKDQAFVLGETGFYFSVLGKTTEALKLMKASVRTAVNATAWKQATESAGRLSELVLTLGSVKKAVKIANDCGRYAESSYTEDIKNWAQRRIGLCKQAGSLYHERAEFRAESLARFNEAENLQREKDPKNCLLYSTCGFWYCDLLLSEVLRFVWQIFLVRSSRHRNALNDSTETVMGGCECPIPDGPTKLPSMLSICREVEERATNTLHLAQKNDRLSDAALDQLTLARITLYRVILDGTAPCDQQAAIASAQSYLTAVMKGISEAGRHDHQPRALLTRALLRFLTDVQTGPGSAQEDLDEASKIAERGPMRLLMADIHLYRARLFGGQESGAGRQQKYPWKSPEADLQVAEELINQCGYHRRDEELADAKRAILGGAMR